MRLISPIASRSKVSINQSSSTGTPRNVITWVVDSIQVCGVPCKNMVSVPEPPWRPSQAFPPSLSPLFPVSYSLVRRFADRRGSGKANQGYLQGTVFSDDSIDTDSSQISSLAFPRIWQSQRQDNPYIPRQDTLYDIALVVLSNWGEHHQNCECNGGLVRFLGTTTVKPDGRVNIALLKLSFEQ